MRIFLSSSFTPRSKTSALCLEYFFPFLDIVLHCSLLPPVFLSLFLSRPQTFWDSSSWSPQKKKAACHIWLRIGGRGEEKTDDLAVMAAAQIEKSFVTHTVQWITDNKRPTCCRAQLFISFSHPLPFRGAAELVQTDEKTSPRLPSLLKLGCETCNTV